MENCLKLIYLFIMLLLNRTDNNKSLKSFNNNQTELIQTSINLNNVLNLNLTGKITMGSNLIIKTPTNSNIYLGDIDNSDESGTIRIGDTQSNCFIAGISNSQLTNPTSLYVDVTTGKLGERVSSIKYKENIMPLENNHLLDKIQTVTFTYKDDPNKIKQVGLIAEQIESLGFKELIAYDKNGNPQGIHYELLSVYLLKEIQDLKNQLRLLKSKR